MSPISKKIATSFGIAIVASVITLAMLPSPYAGLPALVSYYFFSNGSKRRHGQVVERRSVKRMKLPSDWAVEPSKPVPGHGDIDLFIRNPKGEAFAIEIKSQRLVRFSRNFFSGTGKLRYQHNKPSKDAIKQCIAAAETVNAYPIIWFPEAAISGTWKVKNPVPYTVVFGSKRRVKSVIGAPWSLF